MKMVRSSYGTLIDGTNLFRHACAADGRKFRERYATASGNYCPYILDYRGDIVAVGSELAGRLTQQTGYYAYGQPRGDATYPEANRRKFSGKEYATEYGLDEYDFEARRMAPRLGHFTTPDPLAHDNTQFSPWFFCNGDPINLADPTGLKPDEYEAALMAQYVYNDEESMKDALKALNEAKWIISSYNPGIEMNQNNGLKSILFERETDNGTEYAYVFAGTDFTSSRDWAENFLQLFGLSSQYGSAINNSRTLSNYLKYNELTFVGHSLGGGLAAAASLATGREAITFNAAALTSATSLFHGLGSHTERITNFRVTGERAGPSNFFIGGCGVSNLQDNVGLRPPGRRIELPIGTINPIQSHKIEMIIDYFKLNH